MVPLRLLILITKRKRGKKKKRGKRTPNPEDLLVVLGQLLCTESSPAVPARDAAAASSMAVRPSGRCCVLPVSRAVLLVETTGELWSFPFVLHNSELT